MPLDKIAPPALPLAQQEYTRAFTDTLLNVLRLFFVRLTNTLNSVLGVHGGRFLEFPCGGFSGNTDQPLAVANTPQIAVLDTTDYAHGMASVTANGIHFEYEGVYDIKFSAQLTNSDPQIKEMCIWIRKNGVDHPNTGSVVDVTGTHGGKLGNMVVSADFFMEMTVGDYIEFWWCADSTTVSLATLPATTSPYARPLSPAIIVTVTFVDALQQ